MPTNTEKPSTAVIDATTDPTSGSSKNAASNVAANPQDVQIEQTTPVPSASSVSSQAANDPPTAPIATGRSASYINSASTQSTATDMGPTSQVSLGTSASTQVSISSQAASTSALGLQSTGSQSALSGSQGSPTDQTTSTSLRGSVDIQSPTNSQSASISVAGSPNLQILTSLQSTLTSSSLQSSVLQSQSASSRAVTINSQTLVISVSPMTSRAPTAFSSDVFHASKDTGASTSDTVMRPKQNADVTSSSMPLSSTSTSMRSSPAAANAASTALPSSSSVIPQTMGDSRTSISSRTLSVGAENDVTVSPAPSTVLGGSIPTASSSFSYAAATSVSEQGAGSTTGYPPQESGTSKVSSNHPGVRGDSTLSTSIVPAKASGPSSQADVFSNGGSTERPVQGSAPKNRLAGPGLRYSSTASDDNQVQSSPGASPAATKSQPKSTTGIPNGYFTDAPHRQSSAYRATAKRPPHRYEQSSASGEISALPNIHSDSPPQGPPGEGSANTPARSSLESLRNPSVLVTTTNAQGSPITYKVRAAVIKVPVTTTNNKGESIVTESLSTAAATATFNRVITSTNAAGSAVVQTLQIPAVVYTFTNSQGSVATTTSAVVLFNPNHAPGQKSTNPDGRPGSPPDNDSSKNRHNDHLYNGSAQSSAAPGQTHQNQPEQQRPQFSATASHQEGFHAGSNTKSPANARPVVPNVSANPKIQSPPGGNHKSPTGDGNPQSTHQSGDQNYDGSASPDPASAQSGDNGGEVSDTQHTSEGRPKSNDGEVEQNSQSNPGGENRVQPGNQKEEISDTQPDSAGRPQSNNGKTPQNSQSNSPAVNSAQPGSHSEGASDAPNSSEGRPKPTDGEGEQNEQPNCAAPQSVQSGSQKEGVPDTQPGSEDSPQSNDGKIPQNGQSNSRPTSNPGSPAQAKPPSHHGGSSDSSQFNSSDLRIGSAYDRLANRGLAALAGNASRIAEFVHDTTNNQTNAQKQALKSQLKADFDNFVDGLFADPSSGQACSQIGNGYQFRQNLTNQSCSDLEDLDKKVLTEIFFVEYFLNIIYGHYQDVRNVIMKKCR